MADEVGCSQYGAVREEDVVFTDALTHVGDAERTYHRRRSVKAVFVSAMVLLAVVAVTAMSRGGADIAASGAMSLASAGKKHSSDSGGGKHSKHSGGKSSKSSSSDDGDDDDDDTSSSSHSGGKKHHASSTKSSTSAEDDHSSASSAESGDAQSADEGGDEGSNGAQSADADSGSDGGVISEGASSGEGVSAVKGGSSSTDSSSSATSSSASTKGSKSKSSSSVESTSASTDDSDDATSSGHHNSEWSCLVDDAVSIYKYTITSSSAPEDGKWADEVMGCSFRNVTDTHGCSALGKTSCFSTTMAYGLHFVENKITHSGSKDISYWDTYFRRLNEHSFENNKFNQFMHYSLAFYAPDLTDTVRHLINNDVSFLARKGVSPHDGHVYFTVLIESPSGKVFELSSTTLDTDVLDNTNIKRWKDADECPNCHFSQRYAREELDHWYTNFSGGMVHYTTLGLPSMMPVRNNIAVPSVTSVAKWMKKNIPSLEFKMEDGADDGECRTLTTNIGLYTETGYDLEVRFIENPDAHSLEYSVEDFVEYIKLVNANWTAPDYGWTAWYDRHLGLMFNECPLDDYMKKFAEEDISFHPHGRGGSTDNTDTAKDHCWTEGVEGYGIEMQGNFSFTYHDCYQVFDWCTWDTSPKVDNC